MSEPTESPAGAQERVSIRRAPKLSVFLLLGALVGFLAALVLTAAFEVDPLVGFAATFGYLCIYLIPAGLVLGAFVALVLDAASRRRAREVTVSREAVAEPEPAAEPAPSPEPNQAD